MLDASPQRAVFFKYDLDGDGLLRCPAMRAARVAITAVT
jgi:hypothetical protein